LLMARGLLSLSDSIAFLAFSFEVMAPNPDPLEVYLPI
jgi:hypothetical protein